MKAFMVIARVNDIDYLVKVNADSESAAEHTILDRSYCGRHDYGVTACMAYGEKAMKTDTFIVNALNANPVGFAELTEIIDARNVTIRTRDEAERRVEEIKAQMERLEKELAEAQAILA